MNIKELFDKAENGTLTYEQLMAAAGDAKFVDLSEGKYVSKSKYDSDLRAKDAQMEGLNGQITALNETIATRDTDLTALQNQLAEAGQDATKLSELNAQLTSLQQKYDTDTQNYQNQMRQQSYEFAVREFANTKKFTSQAAKRDFTQAMIAKGLQMEGNKLIGGEDFVSIYSAENADAFVVETPAPTPAPAPTTAPTPVPEIVAPTPGPTPSGDKDGGFSFNFSRLRSDK